MERIDTIFHFPSLLGIGARGHYSEIAVDQGRELFLAGVKAVSSRYVKYKVYNKIHPRSLGGSSKVCCYLRHPRSSSPPLPPEQCMRSGGGGAPTDTREKGGLNIPKRGPDRRRVVYVDTKYPSLFSPSLASLTCYRRRRH